MTKIDPEQERRRLTEFYAGQLDGELERVAAQGYELTPIAREPLQAELIKRGLKSELGERAPIAPAPAALPGDPPPVVALIPESSSPDDELELSDMRTIRKFRDLPEALLAKGSLESAGIEVAMADDNTVRMDWFISNFVGGVKLLVKAEDVEVAEQILNQPIPEDFDVTGIGDYQQPRCPKCQSLDVTFQELNRPVAYVSAWVGLPLPVHRQAWRCHSCNAEWEDDGEGIAPPGAAS